MKLLVLANDAVGHRICDYLVEAFPQDLGLVVTLDENSLFQELRSRAIPVATQTILADEALLSESAFDLGILAWWPKIIPSWLASLPKRGFINTHPSLLPYSRGKHYSFWAIVDQVPFGVSLHKVDAGVDTGPIIAQERIPYDWSDTGESLYYKAQLSMVELFHKAYPAIRCGQLKETLQDEGIGRRYAHRAADIDEVCRLNLDKDYNLRSLLNTLRGRTFPGRPACTFVDGSCVYEVSVSIRKKT